MNELGFGKNGSELELDLVYNPLGALPKSLNNNPNALHYFNLKFLPDGPLLMFINEIGCWIRSRILGLPFGDQGMLPGTFVYTSLGTAGRHIHLTDPGTWIQIEVWGPFVLVILLSMLPKIFRKKS